MRWFALVLVFAVGCIEHDYEDPMPLITVHVGGAIIDELDVVATLGDYNYWERQGRTVGPLTPHLVERGAPAPVATLRSLDHENSYVTLIHVDDPPQEGSYHEGGSIAFYGETAMAIGRRDGIPVVAALVVDTIKDAELTLAPVDIEEWGPHSCKRYFDGEQTFYFIANSDFDCDGIYTDADCNPDDFRPCP